MKKVLLAVGHQKLEEHLKANLKPDCLVVGVTTYKEGVYKAVATKNPDILIFRETLPGNEDVLSLIYQIVDNYPSTRIIFVAGNRQPGDKLLETLVNYNIYDIITGTVNAKEIINLARNPNTRADVKHYQLPPSEPRKEIPETFIPTPVQKVEPPVEQPIEDKPVVVPFVNRPIEVKPIVVPFVEQPSEELLNDTYTEPNFETVAEVESINSVNYEANYESEAVVEELPEKKKRLDILPFIGKRAERKNEATPVEPKHPAYEKDEPVEEVKSGGLFGGNFMRKEKPSGNNMNFGEDAGGRIISFIGGRAGVGTTTIAFNTAVALAQKGKRVIFLETDDINPSVSYWYQLFNINEGLESALELIDKKEYSNIEGEIIKIEEYRKSDPINYKSFPKSLDLMFYSRRYLTRENLHERILPDFKELYLHLAYQLDYDYVIVDINSNNNRMNKEAAFRYSNKIFSVVTQDIASFSYYVADIHNIEHKGLKIGHKNHFIVNKFGKNSFSQAEIKKWLSSEKVIILPADDKGMIDANYAGVPYLIKNKKSEITNVIGNIVEAITSRN